MRKVLDRIVLTLAVAILFLSVKPVLADDMPRFSKEFKEYFTGTMTMQTKIDGIKSVKAVSNIKSSNKEVATMKVFKTGDSVYSLVTFQSRGKATISFDIKYKGKKYHCKTRVYLKKYVNPFKSVLIGKKDITSAFNESPDASVKLGKNRKQKISIKVKKGWKLNQMDTYSSEISNEKVINNTTIKLPKGATVGIYVEDAKGYQCWCPIHFE